MAFTHSLSHGVSGMLTSWPTYALAIGGPCSLLLTQTAYQAGFPMVSLPVITVVSPMASLAVGVGLLGETTRLNLLTGAGVGLAVLVTTVGLVTLARTGSVSPAQPRPNRPRSLWPATAPCRARPGPAGAPRRPPLILGAMRPLALHIAAAARPAFGGLAFWAYPAWGTSPYWESIPPEAGTTPASSAPVPVGPHETGSYRAPAHAGPPAR